MAKLDPLFFVRAVLRSFMIDSGLEPRLFGPHFHVTHAIQGKVYFSLQIKKHHTNRLGILHGGTIASMVDLGGSLAVASMGHFATGVSTDMNITYLGSGGGAGKTLKGVAQCDKIGKTLAFTSVLFYGPDGEITARGSHTKYVVHAVKDSIPYALPTKTLEPVFPDKAEKPGASSAVKETLPVQPKVLQEKTETSPTPTREPEDWSIDAKDLLEALQEQTEISPENDPFQAWDEAKWIEERKNKISKDSLLPDDRLL
ncbi:HotDog domain-containing protein [Lasiosphaeris hirsuta]|uniref:HotDog domain-containing protein n=1 Tax=Lasiosphaeris hirsuta TaxID=260670 RepID=A0AA40DQQ9_9PEZI|nr:HotDog domain-containing protein [Lasiosphaeris hirsuta]